MKKLIIVAFLVLCTNAFAQKEDIVDFAIRTVTGKSATTTIQPTYVGSTTQTNKTEISVKISPMTGNWYYDTYYNPLNEYNYTVKNTYKTFNNVYITAPIMTNSSLNNCFYIPK